MSWACLTYSKAEYGEKQKQESEVQNRRQCGRRTGHEDTMSRKQIIATWQQFQTRLGEGFYRKCDPMVRMVETMDQNNDRVA